MPGGKVRTGPPSLPLLLCLGTSWRVCPDLCVFGVIDGPRWAGLVKEDRADEVSRETISKIADAVLPDMVAWQSRPLDRGRFPGVSIRSSQRAGRDEGALPSRQRPNNPLRRQTHNRAIDTTPQRQSKPLHKETDRPHFGPRSSAPQSAHRHGCEPISEWKHVCARV